MKKKRVLHLSKISHGGAAIAAKRLNDSFHETPWASRIAFLDTLEQNFLNRFRTRVLNKIDYEVGKYGKSPLTVSLFGRADREKMKALLGNTQEVKNIHWFPNLPLDLLKGNTVFTLHDMNQFTGACHHSFVCSEFVSKCQGCPQVGPIFQKMVEANHESKFKGISALNNYRVISPSKWLALKARESSIFHHAEISVIPNPIPQEFFSSQQRAFNRARYNFTNSFVVGGVGHTPGSMKGGDFTREVVEMLRFRNPSHNIVYITFGEDFFTGIEGLDSNIRTNDPAQMAAMLSTCDVFLYASSADNLPSLLLEAQSAGVPIISHDKGGIVETYVDKTSGITVASDPFAFLSATQTLLENPYHLRGYSISATEFARTHFSPDTVASKYIDIYDSMS
jgi:glycosyltransferase involved in cell wall biosynthesis